MTEKFREFLANAMKFEPEEKREQIVADAEGMMTEFIRAKVDPTFALYAVAGEQASGDWYLKHRRTLSLQPSLADGFDVARLRAALKHYADFVQSKAFLANKAVAGPYEAISEPSRGRRWDADPTSVGGRGRRWNADPTSVGRAGVPPPAAETGGLSEGAVTQVSLTKHERSSALRQLCLEHFGTTCQACGMSFEKVYGAIGQGYVEVHHLSPISQTDGEHAVDPTKDLVPLCANCHAMIHRLMAAEKGLEGAAALAKLKECLKK